MKYLIGQEAINFLSTFKNAPFSYNLKMVSISSILLNEKYTLTIRVDDDKWDGSLYINMPNGDASDFILTIQHYLKPDEFGWVDSIEGDHNYSLHRGGRSILRLWWD